jgi:hypothetical protein
MTKLVTCVKVFSVHLVITVTCIVPKYYGTTFIPVDKDIWLLKCATFRTTRARYPKSTVNCTFIVDQIKHMQWLDVQHST